MDQDSVRKVVERIKDLPTLPAVVSKIIEIVDNPSTSATDLNKAISMDQALSARVLKLVNSAFYGFPKRIETLTQAIVILGFNTVRSLALSISMVDFFTGSGTRSYLNYTEFWKHSIATSILARLIAKKGYSSISEETFIAGLLHDIGILVLDQFLHGEYEAVFKTMQEENISLFKAETRFGITHCDVGKMLATKWNLPDPLLYAVAYHHTPNLAQDFKPIVSTIHIANIGAKIFGYGGVCDEGYYSPLSIDTDARQIVRLDPDFPECFREPFERNMKDGMEFINAITGKS